MYFPLKDGIALWEIKEEFVGKGKRKTIQGWHCMVRVILKIHTKTLDGTMDMWSRYSSICQCKKSGKHACKEVEI